MAIEFPVKAGGKRTAVFEVGGLDPGKLPKWWGPAGPRRTWSCVAAEAAPARDASEAAVLL